MSPEAMSRLLRCRIGALDTLFLIGRAVALREGGKATTGQAASLLASFPVNPPKVGIPSDFETEHISETGSGNLINRPLNTDKPAPKFGGQDETQKAWL
jgi:hypothetical protein